MIYVQTLGALAVGLLLGFAIGVMRQPLGDSALAEEAASQRKRAEEAEDIVRKLAGLLKVEL